MNNEQSLQTLLIVCYFSATAVFREDQMVGHVPFNLSQSISLFFRRDINKAFAKVIGEEVNRGTGYGLEIACMELVDSFWPYI